MSASIARYLKDFSVPEPVVSAAASNFGTEFGDQLSQLNFLTSPQEPARDIDAELSESFEEGRAAATSELQEVHEAELSALQEAHQAELETLRAQLYAEMSETVANRFQTITAEIQSKLTDQVTQVLIPVLGVKLAETAATHLAEKVNSMFSEPDGVSLIVHGPENLFNIFNEKIRSSGFEVKHVATDDIDLSVIFDDSVMVTRISAWAEATRALGS